MNPLLDIIQSSRRQQHSPEVALRRCFNLLAKKIYTPEESRRRLRAWETLYGTASWDSVREWAERLRIQAIIVANELAEYIKTKDRSEGKPLWW